MKTIYVIGHRGTNECRVRNLIFVVKWAVKLGYPVYVIEQDSEKRVENLVRENGANYIFAFNKGLYNRSWCFNIAHKHVPYDNMICADNDMIMIPSEMRKCVELTNTYKVVKPFTNLIDLSDDETKKLVETGNATHSNVFRTGMNLTSGICIFNRMALLQAGFWDERFRGWGGEDDAMTYDIVKKDIKHIQIKNFCYHMYHPRSASDGTRDHPHYKNNVSYINEHHLNVYVPGNIGDLLKYTNE